MYLTFTEYETMGGKLEKTAFTSLEFKARKLIDKHTFGRLKELDNQVEAVKRCVYDLVGKYDKYNTSLEGNLKAESVDGWSKTYQSTNEQLEALDELVDSYLSEEQLDDGTPYLYRGV